MKPLSECVLYTFVDSAYLRGRDPIEIARALCEGGSDLIQLRAKDWALERIERTALDLRELTLRYGVGLVVNDHLAIARRSQADFCHLGQEDFFDAGFCGVSELAPTAIGLSSHAPEQARRAVLAGASYIAIGPVFPTGTKPGAKPVTLEYVRWAARNLSLPWFAIGGIHSGNLPEVLEAGAKRICAVSAILNAADIARECEHFRNRISASR